MAKPLSDDLRSRVIASVDGGMSCRAAAERFGVSISGAIRWVRAWRTEGRTAALDSIVVTLGGLLERALGILTALALRWGLDPASLGVYTGLRLFLDNTNRSSLGIGLGAVQQIPILRAAGREDEARRVADIAATTNTLTCLAYAVLLVAWAWIRAPLLAGDPLAAEWTWGLVLVAGLAGLNMSCVTRHVRSPDTCNGKV